jgi:C1A family cysteine protease
MVSSRKRDALIANSGALILVLFLGVLGHGFLATPPVFAQEVAEVSLAPINPDFLEFADRRERGMVQRETAEGYGLGFVPSPLDLSHLRGQRITRDYELLGFPASYDLRTQGKLTPIRDQGNCGSCWSFATYGSLESNLLPDESLDFSENNLKNTHGFDWGPCEGGNTDMSTAYLARWSGPVDESDDPYSASSGHSPPGLTPQKHVQEVLIIPDRGSSLDNDNIKQAVMTYGAVSTTMYWNSSYYNSSDNAYRYTGALVCRDDYDNLIVCPSNHGVAIVGWDDSFDRNKFPSVPNGDGAFIIKNSWGTSWGESGYFYVSYYDFNVGKYNYVFNNGESTSNYSHAYQYDPLGWVMSVGYSNPTGWFANIFTASTSHDLSALSFYTSALNSSYEIYVYQGVTISPTSGTLAGSKTGTVASPGYHTITLDSPIALTSGQKFSVVVKLTTPGDNYPIPVESPYPGYSSGATASSGQSYVSINGTSWDDITTLRGFSNTNVCLKAFAISVTETISTPTTLSGPTSGTIGTSYSYTTGGSTTSLGHSVQYRFDWGDGTFSSWLSVGTTSASKSWSSANTYNVKAQARCSIHTGNVSSWSSPLSVTMSCPTPGTPSSPSPSNGATGVSSAPTLTWTCSGASSYDVYFGTSASPPYVKTTTGTSYSPSGLSPLTTYYWKIVSKNSCGSSTSGPVWSFTTVSEAITTPSMRMGSTQGGVGISYAYAAGGASSNYGHSVQYLIDWGDGTNSGWLAVGTVGASKSWSSPGTYSVRAQARCATHTSVVSSWSAPMTVSILEEYFPSVKVLAPNGRETLLVGSTFTIEWGAPPETVLFKLMYSPNGGTSWQEVTGGYVTGSSYDWLVPNLVKTRRQCFVKVIGYDSTGAEVGSDTSDRPFTIEVQTPKRGTVRGKPVFLK